MSTTEYSLVYPVKQVGEKKLVLMGKFTSGINKGCYNGFGGKIEKDDSPVFSVLKELKEEIGLQLPKGFYLKKIADVKIFHNNQAISKLHVFVLPLNAIANFEEPDKIDDNIEYLHYFEYIEKLPILEMPYLDKYWIYEAFTYGYIDIEIILKQNKVVGFEYPERITICNIQERNSDI